MTIGKGEGGSNMDLNISANIGVYHTWVVVVFIDYGVLWYRLIHPLHETSHVFPGRMVRVSGCQVVLCIGNLIEHK
jgi:hypothetical protein